MTILFFLSALTFAAILTAYFRPSWLKAFASGLIRFCDAMQAFRGVIEGPAVVKLSMKPAKPVSVAVIRDPLFEDVESALVNLGTPATAAKRATEQALSGGRRDFETAFKMAIQYARKAA